MDDPNRLKPSPLDDPRLPLKSTPPLVDVESFAEDCRRDARVRVHRRRRGQGVVVVVVLLLLLGVETRVGERPSFRL